MPLPRRLVLNSTSVSREAILKDWSWDRIGTLAVSVATLLILLFGGIRGVATQADVAAGEERLNQSLAAVEARLAAAIEAARTELKAEIQEIRQYHISHLESHAGAAGAVPAEPPRN